MATNPDLAGAVSGSRLIYILAVFTARRKSDPVGPTFEATATGAVIRLRVGTRRHVIAWDDHGWATAIVASEPSKEPSAAGYFMTCGPGADALRAAVAPHEHVQTFFWDHVTRGGGVGDTSKLLRAEATTRGLQRLREQISVTDERAEVALELAVLDPDTRHVVTPSQGARILEPGAGKRRPPKPDAARTSWIADRLRDIGLDWNWGAAMEVYDAAEAAHRAHLSSADGALLAASADGDVGAMLAALERGASLEAKTDRMESTRWFAGETPLLVSICNRRMKAFDLLLARGADPRHAGPFSPLFRAIWCRQEPMVRALLAAGVDCSGEPNPDAFVSTAHRSLSTETFRLVLAAGAPVSEREKDRLVAAAREAGDPALETTVTTAWEKTRA